MRRLLSHYLPIQSGLTETPTFSLRSLPMLDRYKWLIGLVAVIAIIGVLRRSESSVLGVGHGKSGQRSTSSWATKPEARLNSQDYRTKRVKSSRRGPQRPTRVIPENHDKDEPIFTMATLPRDQSGVYLVNLDGEIVEIAVDVPNEEESPIGMENLGESE